MDLFVSECGIVSPWGWGRSDFWHDWDSAAAGGGFRPRACLGRFDPAWVLGPSGWRRMGRANAILLAVAALALAERERKLAQLSAREVGVVTVAGAAQADDFLRFHRLAVQEQIRDHAALLASYRNLFANAAAANISIRFGLQGQGCALGGGRRAGLEAVYYALRLLAQGRLKAVVLGAIELATPMLALLAGGCPVKPHPEPSGAQIGEAGEIALGLLLRAVEGEGGPAPGALCRIGIERAPAGEKEQRLPEAGPPPSGQVDLLIAADSEEGEEPAANAAGARCSLARASAVLRPRAVFGDCYSAGFPLAVACGALVVAARRIPPLLGRGLSCAQGSASSLGQAAGRPIRTVLVGAGGEETPRLLKLEAIDA